MYGAYRTVSGFFCLFSFIFFWVYIFVWKGSLDKPAIIVYCTVLVLRKEVALFCPNQPTYTKCFVIYSKEWRRKRSVGFYYICLHMHTYMWINMYMYINTYTHMYTYLYPHMSTPTHRNSRDSSGYLLEMHLLSSVMSWDRESCKSPVKCLSQMFFFQ